MTDETTPELRREPEHPSSLSDEQLVQRLNDHRRGSGEWAAVLGEMQRRADRHHSDDLFRDALASAGDGIEPPSRDG